MQESLLKLGECLFLSQEAIEILSERLRNAEDKLSAAEHCKMMLNEEVLTMKQAFEKMSSNLEVTNETFETMKVSCVLREVND